MNMENYISARRFAMEYGTFLGIAWLLDFLLLTSGIDGSGMLMLLGILLFIFLPFVTFYMAFRYKQHQPVGERHTSGQAAYFTVMMFIFAELICFLGEYAYFAYIDKGHLMATFQSMLEDPAIAMEYKKLGMSAFLNTAKQQLEELATLAPVDLASNLLGSNVFTSLLLFIPTWVMASMKSRDYASEHKENNE